jgi:hypothetical protein
LLRELIQRVEWKREEEDEPHYQCQEADE